MKKPALFIAACGMSLLLAAPVSASTLPVTAETQAALDTAQGFLRENGVSQVTTNALMQTVKKGEPIGSAADLKITKEVTKRKGDLVVTTETYEDGSVELASVEQPLATDGLTDAEFEQDGDMIDPSPILPVGPLQPYGIDDGDPLEAQGSIKKCKHSSGSGYRSYKSCTVTRTSATATIAFLASYTLVQKGNDYISGLGQASHRCRPASCSDGKSRMIRSKESRAGKAIARGSLTVNVAGGWSSKSFWVQLEVGKNKARAVNGG